MKNDATIKRYYGGGQTLELCGPVTKAKIKALEELEFDCVVISGDEKFDLSYLKDYKNKIHDLGVTCKVNLGEISFLTEIQSLSLHHAKGPFPNFPRLRELTLMTSKAWHPSIGQFQNLEFLRVHGWPDKDLAILSKYSKLIKLEIIDSRKLETLNGCAHLHSLDYIQLVGCSKLTDCSQLPLAPVLQGLRFESCKAIISFEFLSKLVTLVVLGLHIPKFPSLSILKGLPNLRGLNIGHTLIEDKDIAALCEFPSLRDCSFGNKRAYNFTIEQLDQFLQDKWEFPPESRKGSRSGYTIPRFELSP